jgi:ABC-type polysaccharide/polyol phosphate export permease
LIAAVLFTFFRDIRTILQMVLMLAFFSSPILFRADTFAGESLQARLVALHPITYFAALFQKPIYHGTWPGINDWLISFSIAALALATGMYLVYKHKGEFYYYL